MRKRIKQLLQEFKIDELSRKDYKDGDIVMEYNEGHDYPRYVLYYDVQLEDKDEYEMIAEFDSRFFDAGMVETIADYLKIQTIMKKLIRNILKEELLLEGCNA